MRETYETYGSFKRMMDGDKDVIISDLSDDMREQWTGGVSG